MSDSQWSAHFDEASGNTYYSHNVTGDVRWTDPALDSSVEMTGKKKTGPGKSRTTTMKTGFSALSSASSMMNPAAGGGGGGNNGPLFEVKQSWSVAKLYTESSEAAFYPGIVRKSILAKWRTCTLIHSLLSFTPHLHPPPHLGRCCRSASRARSAASRSSQSGVRPSSSSSIISWASRSTNRSPLKARSAPASSASSSSSPCLPSC